MLLERGACPKTLDSNRQSPLQVNREVELRLLVKNGAPESPEQVLPAPGVGGI